MFGCATHATKLDVPASPATTAASPLFHRIVLIGDAGALSAQPVLDTVGRRIRALSPEEQAKTTVLFLGDNVYPSGLPRKDHAKRDEAEAILDAQADLARDFAGRVLMVPGNHDAMGGLVARLERQERYFEKAVTKAKGAPERIDAYLPSNACGGPVEVDLSQEVLLVAVSTPWYLDN